MLTGLATGGPLQPKFVDLQRSHVPGLIGRELNFSRITSYSKIKVTCVSTPSEEVAFTHEEREKKCPLLHWKGSRAAFPDLKGQNRILYVFHANENGNLLNEISDEECSLVGWILVDSATGGSGKGFNWAQFELPPIKSKNGWLLAGGIKPENICEALSILKPHGVDVRSGICDSDGIDKDRS